jgi:tetratricopeptide (TPR) repeat protein
MSIGLPSLPPAIAAFQAGDYQACMAQCRSLLANQPDDEPALALLALALHACGQVQQAAEAYRRLTTLCPQIHEYWSNLGLMLGQLDRFAEAEASYRHALSLAPRSSGTLLNYGLLLFGMGRMAEARHRFLDAWEVEPESPIIGVYASLACFECGDMRRAESLIPPPVTWPALDAEGRHDLAMALINVGRIEEAEALLDPAAKSQDPAALARLASLHERTNRVESAQALLDRIRHHIERGHRDVQVDALTVDAALALRAKDYQRARASSESLLRLDLPIQAQANAYFTLGKIADKQGDTREAMRQLQQAHQLQARLARDISPRLAEPGHEPLQIATRWMQPEECDFGDESDAPSADASPVFIVGFPRSGTTMLEQMLDAHPRYVSMDERTLLQACVERMESRGLAYPAQLDQLDGEDLAGLRALYWTEARKVVALAPGQLLVDKNPLNMLRLPMIRRLFPGARIILALRHPCDVLLSCYMQNFRSPAFMMLCSTLERLATSYVNSMRFWIHHEPLLRPRMLTMRYEDTVGDFLPQVDRIAAFLGIEDRQPLVEFSQHAAGKGYISTPSYSQVVEPVNTRAVARWKAYREWFEPVFPILQPIADHWNYRLED